MSYQQGFLHRNLRGEWYPVCGEGVDREWAVQACRDVVSPDVEYVVVAVVDLPGACRCAAVPLARWRT